MQKLIVNILSKHEAWSTACVEQNTLLIVDVYVNVKYKYVLYFESSVSVNGNIKVILYNVHMQNNWRVINIFGGADIGLFTKWYMLYMIINVHRKKLM